MLFRSLAAFIGVSRAHPMDHVVVAAQHLLGVVSVAAFFVLARRAFGTRVALVGGVLFAAHTTQLFYENSILSEAFFVAVLAVSLLVLVRFVESPTWPRAVGTAVACLALTYTRPVAQWYVVVPIVLVLATLRRPLAWLKYAAVIVGIYVAALMPWAALNERTFGFYGVAIGRMFFGESMFHRERDASKAALVVLDGRLALGPTSVIDAQWMTPHLASLGARDVPREQFLEPVDRLTTLMPPSLPWRFDTDLHETA